MPTHHMLFAIVLALVFALALGAAVYASGSRQAFARDEAKFAAGRGRDPNRRLVGPHRSYLVNVVGFLAIFAPVFLAVFHFYPPPI